MNKFTKYALFLTAGFIVLAIFSFQFINIEELSKLNIYFGKDFKRFDPNDITDFKYENKFKTRDIKNLKINLTFGSAKIVPATGNELTVKINSKIKKDKKIEMENFIFSNGDTFEINLADEFMEVSAVQGQVNLNSNSVSIKESFVIEISVPEGVENLQVNSVSTDWNMSQLKINALKFNTVSGDLALSDSRIQNLNYNTVSGDAELDLLEFKKVDINSVSGDIKFKIDSKIKSKIDFISTSGDITGDEKFKSDSSTSNVKIKTISGDVKFE